MKRTATLRARTGEYIDRQTGQKKNSYQTVGYVLQHDDGRLMYKLDTVPVEFDGWLYQGDLKTKPIQETLQGKEAAAEQRQQLPQDDIPF